MSVNETGGIYFAGETPLRGPRLAVVAVLLIAFLGLLWAVREVLPPFIAAIAIAAVLDPLLERLQRKGIRRIWSVLIVYAVFFLGFAAFLTWIVPIIISEAAALARNWPTYFQTVKEAWAQFASSSLVHRLRLPIPPTFTELADQANDYINQQWPTALSNALGGLFGSFHYVLNTIIILIATFYLLNDWPRIRRRFHYIVPAQWRGSVVDVMDKVGAVFIGYLRGLVVLCGMYGVAVAILLLVLHVNYAFILGMVAALLYAVPYVGSISLAVITTIVTYVGSGGDIGRAVTVVLLVLAINQAFDNVLMPRVLGRSTGLHPLLSLFALIAGSNLLGFAGFIVGVPIAASLMIIAVTIYPKLNEPIPEETQTLLKAPLAPKIKKTRTSSANKHAGDRSSGSKPADG